MQKETNACNQLTVMRHGLAVRTKHKHERDDAIYLITTTVHQNWVFWQFWNFSLRDFIRNAGGRMKYRHFPVEWRERKANRKQNVNTSTSYENCEKLSTVSSCLYTTCVCVRVWRLCRNVSNVNGPMEMRTENRAYRNIESDEKRRHTHTQREPHCFVVCERYHRNRGDQFLYEIHSRKQITHTYSIPRSASNSISIVMVRCTCRPTNTWICFVLM